MATPSLQDVLATEPGLTARIDAMTELIPGVPASKENLRTLLEQLIKDGRFESGGSDGTSIVFYVTKNRKKKDLMVKLLGNLERIRTAEFEYNQRACVCLEVFKCNEDGLLEAFLYAKQSKKRYREEGTCPDCDRPGGDEPLRKKLKAMGMPKCETCMLKAIVGE